MDKNIIRLSIEGMTCAACSASVEKSLNRKKGVETATVNLATNTATIHTDGTITEEQLITTVERAGFSAEVAKETLKTEKFAITTATLATALIFGTMELYIGMSHMLPIKLPLPEIIAMESSMVNFVLIQMVLTIIVLIAGRRFFVSGIKNIIACHPNMDSLVAIGTGTAFIYSLYNTALVLGGDIHAGHNLYYESAAVVVALVLLGKYLEERSKSAAKKAITALASMMPGTAFVERDGQELEVPSALIKLDDIVIVKPGYRIAVDGVIVTGEGSVDESMLTGESIPVYKEVDSKVSGGTICKDGFFRVRATGVGGNTAIAQVLKLVTEAQERKAPAARLADKISGVFVPAVVAIAFVASGIWLLLGKDLEFVMNIFVSVLVVACPCALGLATPIAVMAGSGRGANLGILYRGGDVIEQASKINTVFFDKTGTITHGKLKVATVIPHNIDRDELIKLTASAEKGSEHPIAVAIVDYAEENTIEIISPDSLKAHAGKGVTATIGSKTITAGTAKLMDLEGIKLPENSESLIPMGCTAMFIGIDGVYCGLIALSDTIRDDAKEAIARLNSMGIETGMITGDNHGAASVIAKEAGIVSVKSQVLPQDKSAEVEKAKSSGKVVAMVGDGINDAPALAAADVGIAVHSGTDAAAESSGIILMGENLGAVVDSLVLAKKTMVIIRENLFWAFIYNCIGIPIAAGVLYALGGPLLTPAFAGGAMALSSVSVVMNSLRLTKYSPNKK